MYIKLINGTPVRYNPEQLQLENSGTSFPSELPDTLLVEWGVYPCKESARPTYDPIYETLVEETPVLVDGNWVQQWSVREATREEILQRIPFSVSMRQGRLAMLKTKYAAGTLLDVIEAMLDSIPDPTTRRAARIDWEYAQEIKRDFPLVQQLTAQLGLTERQIDDLFTLAATL